MNNHYSIVWRLNEIRGKRGKKAEELLCRALIKKYAKTQNLAKKLIRQNGLPMLGIDGDTVSTARGRSWKSAKITGSIDLELSGFPEQPPTGEGILWKVENIWIPKNPGSQSDVYVLWTNYAKESIIWRPENKDRQQILWKFHCKDDTNKEEDRLFNVKTTGQKGKAGERIDDIFVDDDRDALAALRQALLDMKKGLFNSHILGSKNPKRAIYAIDKYIRRRLSDGNNFSVKVNRDAKTAECRSYKISNRPEDSRIDYQWIPLPVKKGKRKGSGHILVTSGDVTYRITLGGSKFKITKYSGDKEVTKASNQLLPPSHLYNTVIDEDWYDEVKKSTNERFLRLCGAIIAHKAYVAKGRSRLNLETLVTIDEVFAYATGTEKHYYTDGYRLPTTGLIEVGQTNWNDEYKEHLTVEYLVAQGLIKRPKIYDMEFDEYADGSTTVTGTYKGKFYKSDEFEWTFDWENDTKKPLEWLEAIILGKL